MPPRLKRTITDLSSKARSPKWLLSGIGSLVVMLLHERIIGWANDQVDRLAPPIVAAMLDRALDVVDWLGPLAILVVFVIVLIGHSYLEAGLAGRLVSAGRADRRERTPVAPSESRNASLADLTASYIVAAARTLVGSEASESARRALRDKRVEFERMKRITTGDERRVIEPLPWDIELRVNAARRENTHAARLGAVRSLREVCQQVQAQLLSTGRGSTEHDRTNWLPRIKALLRAQRDEAIRLQQMDGPIRALTGSGPDDLWEQCERWAVRTADLLLDAYGAEVKNQFRDHLYGGGINAFWEASRELSWIIEHADRMNLVDSFQFEEWEASSRSSPDTSSGQP